MQFVTLLVKMVKAIFLGLIVSPRTNTVCGISNICTKVLSKLNYDLLFASIFWYQIMNYKQYIHGIIISCVAVDKSDIFIIFMLVGLSICCWRWEFMKLPFSRIIYTLFCLNNGSFAYDAEKCLHVAFPQWLLCWQVLFALKLFFYVNAGIVFRCWNSMRKSIFASQEMSKTRTIYIYYRKL